MPTLFSRPDVGASRPSLESEFCDKTLLVLKKAGTVLIGMFLQLSIERVQRQRQLYASLDASGATIK
jgi:hypothetical protein